MISRQTIVEHSMDNNAENQKAQATQSTLKHAKFFEYIFVQTNNPFSFTMS
jgi:hypothetical protein